MDESRAYVFSILRYDGDGATTGKRGGVDRFIGMYMAVHSRPRTNLTVRDVPMSNNVGRFAPAGEADI